MLIQKVEKVLSKQATKAKTLQFAMSIPDHGINYSYSNTTHNQRFHSASVGKLMTSTLIFMAVEKGLLSLDTRVHTIFERGMLDKLFVFEGHDYQDEITIKHLLGHTSGMNDYFESKTFDGSLFIDDVLSNPDIFWKPVDVLDFTRNRQSAVAIPGTKFFYSDTGYILLGIVLETVFGMPYHQVLETYLFRPADMRETTLCYYGEAFDKNALAPLYINGVDVHLFKSLSCDFSGGGLSTTAEDLVKFLEYFHEGSFITQQSISQMLQFDNRFQQGLYYGLGMMQVRFSEFFFLLKMLPKLQGHLGVTGVHAWYDPASKASFVLNVGSTKDIAMSFRLLISILQIVYRELSKS